MWEPRPPDPSCHTPLLQWQTLERVSTEMGWNCRKASKGAQHAPEHLVSALIERGAQLAAILARRLRRRPVMRLAFITAHARRSLYGRPNGAKQFPTRRGLRCSCGGDHKCASHLPPKSRLVNISIKSTIGATISTHTSAYCFCQPLTFQVTE